MKDLCRRGDLGTVRKWIRIEFDGVPYCIACNIKEILLKCPKFNVEIDETILEFHLSEMHGVTGKSCLRGEKVSKDVLLVPGASRMEKKSLSLALLLLSQNVFVDNLADLLGVTTENSREFIINC